MLLQLADLFRLIRINIANLNLIMYLHSILICRRCQRILRNSFIRRQQCSGLQLCVHSVSSKQLPSTIAAC